MLLETIDQDLKQSLKSKTEVATSALRNLKAAIQMVAIEKKEQPSDADVLKVIAKKVKQHKDSIESFLAGARKDLADIEVAQMAVLEKYLPKQLSEEEVRVHVKAAIDELKATAADFGKVMKAVVAKVEGAADGNIISKLVKEELSAKGGSAS